MGTVYAAYFAPRCVVVLGERQPVCVLRLAGHKIFSPILY